MSRLPDTADQLRSDIDRGLSGDKVDHSDPAAAPLGTDDEAAGHGPTRWQVYTAATHELKPRLASAPRPLEGFPTLYLGVIVPISAAILLAAYLGSMGRAF
jgi:hypothetical protein